MTLNKMMVIGNAGTDPEMRYTPNGNPVTSFRLATNRRYTTADGEQHEETEWFTVTAWNKLAETVNQYVTKGMKVYAEGRLKSDSWTGNDGQVRFRNEIVAFEVKFLDRAPAGAPPQGGEGAPPRGGEGPPAEGGDAEDLPW
jgi:single-strand DNA-binding protein